MFSSHYSLFADMRQSSCKEFNTSVYCDFIITNICGGLNSCKWCLRIERCTEYTTNIFLKFQECKCTHSVLCSRSGYESFTGWHLICISNVNVNNSVHPIYAHCMSSRIVVFIPFSVFIIGYRTPKRTMKFTSQCFKHACQPFQSSVFAYDFNPH